MTGSSHDAGAPAGREAPGWLPLLALGLILLITAGWWALALWPVPAESPAWLVRTRSVCFGSTPSGLPDAEGWIALVLQPTLMIGTLLAIWGTDVRRGFTRARASLPGRAALLAAGLALLTGVTAAGWRVGSAAGGGPEDGAAARAPRVDPAALPRLDRPVPAFELVDQAGRRVSPDDLRGSPTLVTFAYGHCSTVCPMVVSRTLRAAEAARGGTDPSVLIVTLDPWRDTPSRLPHLAERWGVGPGVRVASGDVEAVNAALDAWRVPRKRNTSTGEITHPALVYVVDAGGRIAFASDGDPAVLEALLERL